MRTFVTGMVFMAVLAAALFQVMAFAGLDLPDIGGIPQAAAPSRPGSLARFEPSSPAVVDEMLRLARVTRDDVVYDLGSGDGRVLIAAAGRAGARCVGVEIDRRLIEESRKNARNSGVSHLVQFIEQDLSRADLSKASVVMLYLSPEANLMLRPRLLAELKPGARVVSHTHDMGDWKPDKASVVENHHVYFWIVPARVTGSWKLKVADTYGADATLEFTQAYQSVTGRLRSGKKYLAVSNVRLRGKALSFRIDGDFGSVAGPAEFTGEVEQASLAGGFRSKNLAGAWSAKRKQ